MKKRMLYLCSLKAPSNHQMEETLERIRYWPFVKSYIRHRSDAAKVILYVHTSTNPKNQDYYLERSKKLVSDCLRQEEIIVSRKWKMVKNYKPIYTPYLYVRPDDSLKVFAKYIDELDKCKI